MNSKGRAKTGASAPVESSVESSSLEPSTIAAASGDAVGARIAEVRARRTQAAFAELLGVSEVTVGRYERGERLPDAEFLSAIARAADISTHWLLYGAEPRKFSEALHPDMRREGFWKTYTKGLAADHRAEEPAAGYVQIPLYDVRAGAGNGAHIEGERVVDSLAFKEEWIRQELRASPGDLRLINVSGDSMEPDLRAGDIILIDHTDARASREGIYVIRMDGALLVKQLQRLPGGVVKVISRNQAYEPFTVRVADLEEPNGFAIIGRVVWACRRL